MHGHQPSPAPRRLRAADLLNVLAHAADGATLFGTGGASVNAASLAMNRAVGYEIIETWHTYSEPGDSQG